MDQFVKEIAVILMLKCQILITDFDEFASLTCLCPVFHLLFFLFSIYFMLTIKIEYDLVYLRITIARHKTSAN